MSLLPLIVLIQTADAASVEEEQAEMARILEDMKQFREKANWVVVEKRYQQLSEFSKASPTVEMHLLGAEAASNLGNVSAVKTRLEASLALEETEKTKQWYDSIDANYAPVTIKVPKKFDEIPDLNIATMPFFPDQQLALAFAQKSIQENRKFQGYVPFGEYTIAGSTFTVANGDSGEVVVVRSVGSTDAVAKKTKPKDSKKPKDSTSSDDSTVAMRLDLGVSAASAGESSTVNQAQPFGGVGTRVGVGVGYGLSDALSLVAEVGYHGSFGAGEAPVLSGVTSVGYDATPTLYHGAFGWLAASMAFNDVEVLVGPITEFATIQTQGISLGTDSMEYSQGQGDYIPVKGSILASGLSGGITYAGMNVGDGLLGGVSTYVGAQSDGARWYTWGQVSLTIKGQ
jgi:hypothetical protein